MIFSAAYNTGHSPSKNNLRCSVGKGHAYLLFQLCYISSLGSGLKPILLQNGSNGLLLADRFFIVQTVSKCLRRFAGVFAAPAILYILEQPITNIISPSEHQLKKRIVNNHLPVSCYCQLFFVCASLQGGTSP